MTTNYRKDKALAYKYISLRQHPNKKYFLILLLIISLGLVALYVYYQRVAEWARKEGVHDQFLESQLNWS